MKDSCFGGRQVSAELAGCFCQPGVCQCGEHSCDPNVSGNCHKDQWTCDSVIVFSGNHESGFIAQGGTCPSEKK